MCYLNLSRTLGGFELGTSISEVLGSKLLNRVYLLDRARRIRFSSADYLFYVIYKLLHRNLLIRFVFWIEFVAPDFLVQITSFM